MYSFIYLGSEVNSCDFVKKKKLSRKWLQTAATTALQNKKRSPSRSDQRSRTTKDKMDGRCVNAGVLGVGATAHDRATAFAEGPEPLGLLRLICIYVWQNDVIHSFDCENLFLTGF